MSGGGVKEEEEMVLVYVDRIERRDVGLGMGRMGGGEGRGMVGELWMLHVCVDGSELGNRK